MKFILLLTNVFNACAIHTVGHKNSQLIFVCNFVKSQQILIHFHC